MNFEDILMVSGGALFAVAAVINGMYMAFRPECRAVTHTIGYCMIAASVTVLLTIAYTGFPQP